jgi:hypothetical protein
MATTTKSATIVRALLSPPPFPSIFKIDFFKKFIKERAGRMHAKMVENGFAKFRLSFFEAVAESLPNFKRYCKLPTEFHHWHVMDVSDMDSVRGVVRKLQQESILSFDSEHCSWNAPFAAWPPRFLKPFGFLPAKTQAKGPFMCTIQLATKDGSCYIFDVRQGIPESLVYLLEDQTITKLGWGMKSDNIAMQRTFGFGLNSSFVDLQLIAQRPDVNNGLPTALADYAMLFADTDIRTDKVWHGMADSQRWNPSHLWADSVCASCHNMLDYAARDAYLLFRIGCGLAYNGVWPNQMKELKCDLTHLA